MDDVVVKDLQYKFFDLPPFTSTSSIYMHFTVKLPHFTTSSSMIVQNYTYSYP